MAGIKNDFLKGVMNKDLDESLVPPGSFRDALNVDITHAEGDDAGTVRNKKGNTKIQDLGNVAGQPLQNGRTIGATSSEADNLLYYLVASDKFDGIYEYNETTGVISRILQSKKSTPNTPSQLNFNQDYYVTGINFIDGFLYWTDDLNPPRRINISRARSYNIDDSRIDDDISVILAAPLYAPTIDMTETVGSQQNNMEEKFLQFSYRFEYLDNQYSAMAPFSGVAFVPNNFELDYGVGENKAMLNAKNGVLISFRTGNRFVKSIELLMRDTKSMNISVVESFDKEQLDILNDNIHSYNFSNNKTYSTLPSSQLTRLFDNVPLKAKAQSVIDRRIVYGNYEQSYDITDSLGQDIAIDYKVGYVSKTTPEKTPIQTFRSDRDYEIGIQYGDEYGRFSTVLTTPHSEPASSTVYIPPTASVTGNSISVAISNKPPEFATKYRLVVKQSKGKYYNIFPTIFYAYGSYRYFLVNDFDKDKIRVGEYIIFKSDFSGATLNNKRYKILELESKVSGFTGSGTTNVPGLYFKIKVDFSSEFNPNLLQTHAHTSKGTNDRLNVEFEWNGLDDNLQAPLMVNPGYSYTDPAIHYGVGSPNVVSVPDHFGGTLQEDIRFTIEITSQTEFKFTADPTAGGGWSLNQTIPLGGGDFLLQHNPAINGLSQVLITWSNEVHYQVGDYWKINCRCAHWFADNVWGKKGRIPGLYGPPSTTANELNGVWGGSAVLPGPSFSPSTIGDTEIQVGAIISMRIIEDSLNPATQDPVKTFPPSPVKYENIEEWWYESGAYNILNYHVGDPAGNTSNTNIQGRSVSFRRGIASTNSNGYDQVAFSSYTGTFPNITYVKRPVYMIITGQGYYTGNSAFTFNNPNTIKASIQINQVENLAQCETVPVESDADIFHETTHTYPISNGLHKVLWDYQDFTTTNVGGTNYTNLGQLIPGTVPSGIEPHTFQVGDQVEVHTSTSPHATIPGTHTVIAVVDKYNVAIDLPFPGSGATTAGSIGFYHLELEEKNQTNAQAAEVLINVPTNTNSTYNAYAFGTGLESDRIRDNFNSTTVEYSPRASTTIENYGKNRKESSLTYSGTYRDSTSTNGLNEFNLSLVNFKNLDIEFGSIQKIHARDTDLLVFQEDKISRVLYGKNLLSDAIGGGSVTTTPEVLGTQISDKGEWGISFNPESFAEWANNIYWTDSRRGAVLSMRGDGIVPISNLGMKSYFRDLMKDNPNTQKLGVFDPNSENYILASNEKTSRPCDLTLSKYGADYPSNIPNQVGTVGKYDGDFTVFSNSSWTAAIVYSAGSGWVTGWPASGFGNENVDLNIANNTTLAVRTATITFTFCDTITVTYVVTQAAGTRITVHPWVLTNKD